MSIKTCILMYSVLCYFHQSMDLAQVKVEEARRELVSELRNAAVTM